MDDELSLATDEERLVALEACEKRMFSAFRRGLEATFEIGKELVTIENGKLYDVRGYNSLSTYAERELRIDEKAVRRCLDVYSVTGYLEGAGVVLPSNESQVLELARLPQEQVVPIWEKLVDACEKKDVPVTVSRVRAAVNLSENNKPASKPGIKAGVKATLKMDEEPLSENGERALARIRRICGEQIADAIKSGTRQLTERAIIKWAELKDQQMRILVHYVIDQGWSVNDAIAYEEKILNARSSLADIALRARAWGGHFVFQYEEFLVSFDAEKKVAVA